MISPVIASQSDQRVLQPRNRRWIFVLGGWTVFGLYMAFQNHYLASAAGRAEPWTMSFIRELMYSTVWAILTPFVLVCAKKFPLDRSNWARIGALHLMLSAIVSLVHKFFYGLALAWYVAAADGAPLAWERLFRTLFSYFDYGMLLYWIMLLFTTGITYFRRYQENLVRSARLESQLAQAQLLSLKMQIQPHFLFNTLNAISVLVSRDPELARRTIGRLSDLLRFTLDQGSQQEIPLATELKILEKYLSIEKTRFGDRLRYRMNIDRGVANARVPALILQPLVENAIKHGVARRRGPTNIDITVSRVNGQLHLAIRNDIHAGGAPVSAWKEGVGLANTRGRIQQLYGSAAGLRHVQDHPARVTVEVTLPFRKGADGDD